MSIQALPRGTLLMIRQLRLARNISQRAKEEKTKRLLSKIIRVDHAGELGAEKIYEGQIAVLGKTAVGPILKVEEYIYIHLYTTSIYLYMHSSMQVKSEG